jgi:GT2 family glycosyltransferase
MGGGAQTTMSVDVSLVLVAHRSSEVARAAVESFRRESVRLGVTFEVVIVDQSEDAGEATQLGSLEPEKLLVLPNRGYAAGINRGVAASTGVTVVAGNPDVVLGEGSLAALLDAIGAGWHIVGPQFVLAGFLFPPADLQTPGEELLRWLASRSRALWHCYFRRELRRWRQVWEAKAPVPLRTLSGALLAFRRETFNSVGAWDEGFFLYFEETEWLARAAAARMRVGLVPGARVEHLWGHAADPETHGAHSRASRTRFLAGRFGWVGRLASGLRITRTPLRPLPFAAATGALPGGRKLWLLSPTPLGFPAAGLLGTAADLERALQGVATARGVRGRFVILAVDAFGARLAGAWAWEAHDG